jgi:hypothetical protein
VANGLQAIYKNTGGFYNTAIGTRSLFNETTGSYNIAIGRQAGFSITTGRNNIEIGAAGGVDNAVIRLGTPGTQKATYVAGISGTGISGTDVVVSSTGLLGVLKILNSLQERQPIRSDKLYELPPVSFRYKHDSQGELQYGLIAEEVAKVYPELMVRGEKGEVESVQYGELIPLMLNEVQKLKAENVMLEARLKRLQEAKSIASR